MFTHIYLSYIISYTLCYHKHISLIYKRICIQRPLFTPLNHLPSISPLQLKNEKYKKFISLVLLIYTLCIFHE